MMLQGAVRAILCILVSLSAVPVLAAESSSQSFFPKGHLVLQVGAFKAYQGRSQNIGIDSLIGDRFTVTDHTDQNILFGLGYFMDGISREKVNLSAGVNAFFLPYADVKGNVIQEDLFTNLSYRYSIINVPIYLAAKTLFVMNDKQSVTIDLGVGPNIISTSDFNENSLDGGVTLPDNIFSGKTSVAFSGTVGVGVRFNKVFGSSPLEVGYRFFYLGQGSFKKESSQVLTTLKTGNSYANAIVFSTSI